jgi:hypothetical protein
MQVKIYINYMYMHDNILLSWLLEMNVQYSKN